MPSIKNISCGNDYTPAATLGPWLNSNGAGYFSVTGNDAIFQVAYKVDGTSWAWDEEQPAPVGVGYLSGGALGVRFKNATPNQTASVDASIGYKGRPTVSLGSVGIATPANNKLTIQVDGTTVGTEPALDLIAASELAIVGVDDIANARVTASIYAWRFNVVRYGADPTGANDSTTAIQNAINACETAGEGRVYFPAGTYKLGGTLAITGDGIYLDGASQYSAVTILANQTNLDMLDVTGDDFTMTNMWWDRNAAGTAGANINLGVQTNGRAFIHRCVIRNGFNNIQVVNSPHHIFSKLRLSQSVNAQLILSGAGATGDTGNFLVEGCYFLNTNANTSAGIVWNSGGGTRIIGCKWNGPAGGTGQTQAILIAPASGVATSQIDVHGCQFDSPFTAISVNDSASGGLVDRIVIVGNSFSPTGGDAIDLSSGGRYYNISSNFFYDNGGGNIGILVDGNATHFRGEIASNAFYQWDTAIDLSAVASANDGINVGPNAYIGCTYTVKTPGGSAPGAGVGDKHHEYTFALSNNSNATYKGIIQLDLATNDGLMFEMEFGGLVTGVGSFVRYIRKIVNRSGVGAIVTAVNDTPNGAAIDLQFDVATVSGSVIIGYKLNVAGGGTNLTGQAKIKVSGLPAGVKVAGLPY